jgi:hypothetical protein
MPVAATLLEGFNSDAGSRKGATFVLVRALTYATLFISLVLIFLPARVLSSAGITAPGRIGPWQVAGMLIGAAGAALALSCVLTFAFVGKGTPAPFDPPRRLVVSGSVSLGAQSDVCRGGAPTQGFPGVGLHWRALV